MLAKQPQAALPGWRLALKRFPAISLCSVLVFGAHAVAAPPGRQAVNMKRQLVECMIKRMKANRTLSYNDAMRTCKETTQPANEALASIGPNDSGPKAP